MLSYALKLTDESADAEDAVQEVMLKLWNIRRKLDEYHSIEALSMTMTRNACMDQWRSKRTDTIRLLPIAPVERGHQPLHPV